ncbi:hypothetical protein K1719_012120 [Acacia pycnantha]|nr:hypothetical protein K1719_012120 [Acacia pycnantha]
MGRNDVSGNVDDRVVDLLRRLDACRRWLRRWSSRAFPNFSKEIDQLRQKLNICHVGRITDGKLEEIERLVGQLEELWSKEESYWWQRSRISWLKCGDKNTKFFHNSVIQRRQRNKILRLKDENGTWLEERATINKAFSTFYKQLFSSDGTRPMELALSYVQKVILDEDNAVLLAPVSDIEIEEGFGAAY